MLNDYLFHLTISSGYYAKIVVRGDCAKYEICYVVCHEQIENGQYMCYLHKQGRSYRKAL